MSQFDQRWQFLENQPGDFRRIRFDASSPCDLYLGLKMPEAERMMLLRLPRRLAQTVKGRPPFQGLRIDPVSDSANPDKFFLNLVLTDPLLANVFDVLLDDLIGQLLDLSEPNQIVQTFFNQLTRWESLFSRFSAGGLSVEQQKGLFGELYVLRQLLTELPYPLPVIESWVGNEAAIQDFRSGNWAIEVKTSSQTTHERFTVNGERQLDETPLAHLFLVYLNVDVRPNGGESLNDLVASIRQQVGSDPATRLLFNRKLSNAGYFDAQAGVYNTTGYALRTDYIFRIIDSFPRITPGDLSPGVGDVRYSVSVAECLPFQITQQQLIQHLI